MSFKETVTSCKTCASNKACITNSLNKTLNSKDFYFLDIQKCNVNTSIHA